MLSVNKLRLLSLLFTHLQIYVHIQICVRIHRSLHASADLSSLANLNTDIRIFFTHTQIWTRTHRSEHAHRDLIAHTKMIKHAHTDLLLQQYSHNRRSLSGLTLTSHKQPLYWFVKLTLKMTNIIQRMRHNLNRMKKEFVFLYWLLYKSFLK